MENTNEEILKKMEERIDSLTKNIGLLNKYNFDKEFEKSWKQLIYKEKDKIKKVKRNFVYEFSKEILGLLRDKGICNDKVFPVEETVNYVFLCHYFHTCSLNDEERASKQKDAEYKAWLKKEVVESIIRKQTGISALPTGTPYNPEIYTCNFLCDCILKILANICDENAPGEDRFWLLMDTYIDGFFLIKSIMSQLTNTYPRYAVVSWRTLFELECKALVLNRYGDEVAKECKRFEELDECYGWIKCIDKNLPSTFKSLAMLCGEEGRYSAYRLASKFVHNNNRAFLDNDDNEMLIYTWLLGQISLTIKNLVESFTKYINDYQLSVSEHDCEELNELYLKYFKVSEAYLKEVQTRSSLNV